MSIPLKDLVKRPEGSFEYYEIPSGKSYQKLMRNAKSYACRAKVSIETEKYRCITSNDNFVRTLVKITILKGKGSQ